MPQHAIPRGAVRAAVIAVAAAFLIPTPGFAQTFAQQGPKLVGTGAVGGAPQQGRAVAISSDGNTAISGGPADNLDVGAAWIFTRTGSVWSQEGAKLVGSGAVGASKQGTAVAISAGGNTVVVAGPADNSGTGAVWIFVRTGPGIWSQQGPKLVGTGAVGASLQGTSVAISANGDIVLVGGSGDNGGAGAAWVFTRDGAGTWAQQGSKLTAADAAGNGANVGFGSGVALSGDGGTALIGGPGDSGATGASWVFARSGSTWTQQGGKLTGTGLVGAARFGAAVALAADGATAAIGGPGDDFGGDLRGGAVWVFTRSGSTWTQQGAKLVGGCGTACSGHGTSVSLSSDGNLLLEGAPIGVSNGGAFAFERSGGSWTPLGGRIMGTGFEGGDDGGFRFGESLMLSSDGATAIIGAWRDGSGVCCGLIGAVRGAAWIFTRAVPPPPPPTMPKHAAGDIDGDGRMDAPLLKANGEWAFLQSTTGFTTSFSVSWAASGIPVRGNFDGDNEQDPAVYDLSTGAWSILTSSSNFTSSFLVSWGGTGYVPVAGDYDGDGRTDPAVYQRSTGLWLVLESSSSFTTSRIVSLGGPSFTPVPGQDFDGDGIADLAVYRQSTGVWSVRTSSTSFTAGFDIPWGGPGVTLVPADYDGDFKADLATHDRATGEWRILTSSSGYSTSVIVTWGGGGNGYLPVPGLFDGDAICDLGLYEPSTGNWYILRGGTGFTTSMAIAGWGASNDVPFSTAITVSGADLRRVSDHDGDGRSEITVYNTTSGVWSSRTSASGFTGATNRGWGGSGFAPAPGDYDGDGKTDLGLYEEATGWWYVLLSSANFTTSLAKNVGGPGWSMVPGDYDGDGLADLAVYNTSTGQWYGLESSTHYTTSFTVFYGGTGWTPVPADYDGDGKADAGVYNGATGVWSILLSTTNFTTSLGASLGGSGWTPVQADYDGDGKADLVVYNEVGGHWSGLTSSTNYTPAIDVVWGGSGYQPVRGDYDGDGRADFATYVASSGMWYIRFSGGSSITSPWGGPGYAAVPQYP